MPLPEPAYWPTPERFPVLNSDETHVWRFGLLPSPTQLQTLEAVLDPGERSRADRFRGDGLRSKFVAGRGLMRRILGAYLERDPSDVRFGYGIHGKPELADEAARLRFNLAHSGAIALCAVTRRATVGVDVEWLRPLENAERIIQRFFSDAEQMEFLSLPENERFAAFYLGWTRKEAFLKAKGTGLATRLDSFDVNLTPGRPAAILRVDDDFNPQEHWRIVDLDPGKGYAGAVVVASGQDFREQPIVHRFEADFSDFNL